MLVGSFVRCDLAILHRVEYKSCLVHVARLHVCINEDVEAGCGGSDGHLAEHFPGLFIGAALYASTQDRLVCELGRFYLHLLHLI